MNSPTANAPAPSTNAADLSFSTSTERALAYARFRERMGATSPSTEDTAASDTYGGSLVAGSARTASGKVMRVELPAPAGERRGPSMGLERRARSIPLEISVELPDGDADETMLAVAEGRVTHQVVKKRRRIPVWLTLSAFGTVLYAAAVSSVCLAFSAYIFNKARQPRAQNAVDAQTAVVLPILKNITQMLSRMQPPQ